MEVIRGSDMKKSKKFHTPFDPDEAISEWSRRMKNKGALEDGMIAELEAHLRDEVKDLIGQGKSLEKAFYEVTESVESADVKDKNFLFSWAGWVSIFQGQSEVPHGGPKRRKSPRPPLPRKERIMKSTHCRLLRPLEAPEKRLEAGEVSPRQMSA